MSPAAAWRAIADTGRLMVGVPSYRTYAEHMATAHPGEPVMSEAAFFRNRQEARYGGRGGGKCC
ncbi:YbdD/YjiX family protein [Sphingomonas sp. A2-49]|uniref:YbdD/YjiX family protein n=1 Tax=Sphingomonas sp. A2-49 TaxID=1391375 RepID=UPI0021D1A178|nr:YbdD/YjiX family protein [Sphingomonas sp. A2-49]MCU6452605.1 YbdD/YjiX family protein [Sphingomonas sp. A2-49]